MAGRLPDRRSRIGVVMLGTRDGGWSSPPLVLAGSMRQRLVGLRPWSLGHGLIVAGATVHGIGMVEPLGVVALDRAGRVVAARLLAPGAALHLEGAAVTIEVPGGHPLPQVGVRLVARPMLGRCRDA
jgi:hypothetical protein